MRSDAVASALIILGTVLLMIVVFRSVGRRADGAIRYTKNERIVVGMAGVCMVGSAVARWAV